MERKHKVTIALALIALAAAVVFVATGDGDDDSGSQKLLPVPDQPQGPAVVSKWAVIATDDFDQAGAWYEGDLSANWPRRWTIDRTSGSYRWQVEIEGSRIERLQEAPYGPAQDLRVAVDVTITQQDRGRGAAGLLFGRSSDADYSFWMDEDGYFEILRGDGEDLETLVRWTSAPPAVKGTNRLEVEVLGRLATFRINGEAIGQMTLAEYVGGKVGVVAGGDDQASFVADFDNFRLERPEH